MVGKRLTREDIKRLKLRRKKKIKRMVISSMTAVLLVGIGVFLCLMNSDKNSSQGGELGVGVQAVIGTPTDVAVNYSDVIDESTSEETVEPTTEEPDDLTDFEFVVPETTLSPVEEIAGNNWYDESKYQKVEGEPVNLNYFYDAVFVGDSRSEGLIIYAGLPNLNGFCYKGLSVDKLDSEQNIFIPGYPGSYTCYDAIETVSYDSYYCMFGVNELGWVNVDVFIEHFNNFIDHIRLVNEDAMIYVESILPVTEAISNESPIYKQERINEFNEKILEMCQARGDVIYLDIAAAVTDENGYLPAEATPDGVHCNSDYCKRIIQYIRLNTFESKENDVQ